MVDPAAAPAPWLSKLHDALAQLKLPGLQALFDGNAINVGGSISAADRDRILGSLKSRLVGISPTEPMLGRRAQAAMWVSRQARARA